MRRLILFSLALTGLCLGLHPTHLLRPSVAQANCSSVINNAEPEVNQAQYITFLVSGCSQGTQYYSYYQPGSGWSPITTIAGGLFKIDTANLSVNQQFAVDVYDAGWTNVFNTVLYPKANPYTAPIYLGAAGDSRVNGTKDSRAFLELNNSQNLAPGSDCDWGTSYWTSVDDANYGPNWYQMGFDTWHLDSLTSPGTNGINSCGNHFLPYGLTLFFQSTITCQTATQGPCGDASPYVSCNMQLSGMLVTVGPLGNANAGCQVNVSSISGLTPGGTYDFRFVATDSCHFQGQVNYVTIVTVNDCSIGNGWIADGGSAQNGAMTGVIEEGFNDGRTDRGNTSYAGNIFTVYGHQPNYNYIATDGSGPYAVQMQKIVGVNGCQQAPNVGTTINYNGHFYEFLTGTFDGTPC